MKLPLSTHKRLRLAIILSLLSFIPLVLTMMAIHTLESNVFYLLGFISGPAILLMIGFSKLIQTTTQPENKIFLENLFNSPVFFIGSLLAIQVLYFYSVIREFEKIKAYIKRENSETN